MSLFELPVSRGARRTKLALVLVLDAILAGAGVVMILSYLAARRTVDEPPEPRQPATFRALSPSVVEPSPSPSPKAERSRIASPLPSSKPRRNAVPRRSSSISAAGRARGGDEVPARESERAGTGSGTGSGLGGDAGADDDRALETLTAQLHQVVDRHQAQLERCYERAAKADGPADPLAGRIDVRFTLMPNGTAVDVQPTDNTTGSPQLASCVADLLRGWSFPASREPIDLAWPFLFRPPANP